MPDNQTDFPHNCDTTRPAATSPDHDYSLTIEDAAEHYAAAGLPRTLRTVQRYCAKGDLDCRKVPTTFGDKYVVAPYSVSRHIAQIQEVIAFTNATSRDPSRQDAASLQTIEHTIQPQTVSAASPDITRSAATSRAETHEEKGSEAAVENRYVKALERENEFLRDQIHIKDTQITVLSERARETNFLIKGLQDLFLRLNPGRSESQRSDPVNSDNTTNGEARPN